MLIVQTFGACVSSSSRLGYTARDFKTRRDGQFAQRHCGVTLPIAVPHREHLRPQTRCHITNPLTNNCNSPVKLAGTATSLYPALPLKVTLTAETPLQATHPRCPAAGCYFHTEAPSPHHIQSPHLTFDITSFTSGVN